ncbi:MAG: sulfur transferase domain-containing protein [Gemmatimonadota bacterium]
MVQLRRAHSVAWLCAIVAWGCSTPEPPAESTVVVVEKELPAVDQAVLDAAEALEVRNARLPAKNLLTAGQPDQDQFEALRVAGAQTFVSLRPASESGAGWEELYAAENGIDFARLPISGSDALTRENVDAFADLMADAGDGPVVLYCGSSNRVGAMVALKAYWIDGAPPESALQMGLDAGMTRLEGEVRALLGLE